MSRGAPPRLVVITDWSLPREQLLSAVSALAPLGARIAIQHRAPGWSTRSYVEAARALLDCLGPKGPPLFVSARLDVALALGAHLHLPGAALPADEIRAHLPADRWLSVAVHEGALDRATGADLALVSPVFAPGSKPNDTRPPLGPEGFSRIARALPVPAFALGGITAASLPQLQGVAGVAVVSAILRAEAPLAVAASLLAQLERGAGESDTASPASQE